MPLLIDRYEAKLTEYQNEIQLRDIKIEEVEAKHGEHNNYCLDDLEDRIQVSHHPNFSF